jgi:hypothetical protein
MDRTEGISKIGSRILLAALVLQALTPDAYDLAMIAHHRPPGPVVVFISVLNEDREDEDELHFVTHSEATARCSCGLSSSGEDPSAPPADNILQPLWPEVGLSRALNRPDVMIPHPGSIRHALPLDPAGRRQGDRPTTRTNPGKDPSLSTCRMTC